MTFKLLLMTFVGGFIFPFMIHLGWGRLVEKFGAIGGFLAALFIVGTTWALNHGYGLVYQSSEVWVDMGLAAGVGLFVASTVEGGDLSEGMKFVLYAIIGGILGGYIIS